MSRWCWPSEWCWPLQISDTRSNEATLSGLRSPGLLRFFECIKTYATPPMTALFPKPARWLPPDRVPLSTFHCRHRAPWHGMSAHSYTIGSGAPCALQWRGRWISVGMRQYCPSFYFLVCFTPKLCHLVQFIL